ncbi:hypothetical protein IQ264_29940 [Phormidium sp. LEGE 05292]|uniref:hypothetical protein n=1 Tax=[Phormidium] sp. LEGE 05292 TaxID=767427 RepID=UPI00187F8933|nr:hypothetical protein [Phormidium sp. LEGE 05292]MBE9229631.1 hypothetical protein [Phormidium sp. LEGE 05292]
MQLLKSGMAKNRLAQQRSPELPKFKNPALNQQSRRPTALPIQPSPRWKNPKKQTINERRRRVNPALHKPLPWNQLLVQLILKRPLLLLLTFCGGMVIAAGLAVFGLTRPEPAVNLKDQPTPATTPVSSPTQNAIATPETLPSPPPKAENSSVTTKVTQQTQQNLPEGLYYVALGAGCGVGAWLLNRRRLVAAKIQRKQLPKSLPGEFQEKSPSQQKNSKLAKRIEPSSRKPLVANPEKIPVADSIKKQSMMSDR